MFKLKKKQSMSFLVTPLIYYTVRGQLDLSLQTLHQHALANPTYPVVMQQRSQSPRLFSDIHVAQTEQCGTLSRFYNITSISSDGVGSSTLHAVQMAGVCDNFQRFKLMSSMLAIDSRPCTLGLPRQTGRPPGSRR